MLLARKGEYWEQATSTDGMNWTESSTMLPGRVVDLAYGDGKFVAAGNYSFAAPGISTSTDEGRTWINTLRSSGTWNRGGVYMRVAFGGGTFVAVGTTYPTDQPLVYGDGFTWAGPTGGTTVLQGVTYGNNQFVVISSGGVISTSTDGTNWASQISGTTANLRIVAYGGGRYLVLGDNVTLTSTDGKQWQTITSTGRSNTLTSVAYGARVFVGVGPGGLIQSTTDGTEWITRRSPNPGPLNPITESDVTFYRGAFYVADNNVRGILQSGQVNTLRLQTQVMTGGNQLQLTVSSDPGTSIRVQVSTNLADWQDWQAITNITGSTNLVDVPASTSKFYRAMSP